MLYIYRERVSEIFKRFTKSFREIQEVYGGLLRVLESFRDTQEVFGGIFRVSESFRDIQEVY